MATVDSMNCSCIGHVSIIRSAFLEPLIMNTMTSNATAIYTTPLMPDQSSVVSHVETTDVSLNAAITALRGAWSQTEAAFQSSRDGLYEFLGLTYQYASEIGSEDDRVTRLRLGVRAMYDGDSQKATVAKKTVGELLLAASMGIEQAPLRSKYKKLFDNAAKEGVAGDVESFKAWLLKSGGIVNALKATVGGLSMQKTGKASTVRPVESLMGDLIATSDQTPTEERTFSASHNNFTVVLFYTNPVTKATHRIAVLADPAAVEAVIRNAVKTACELNPVIDKAA
jgi:hypothetical protein